MDRWDVKYLLDLIKSCNLSHLAHTSREQLTALITDPKLMSFHMLSQLKPNPEGVPYHLHPNEPEQVTVIKKLLNMLYYAENAFSALEKLELGDDENYLVFMASQVPLLIKNAYTAVTQMYQALQLLNHAGPSVQMIFGAQLERMIPALDGLFAQIKQYTPAAASERMEEQMGTQMGIVFSALPNQRMTAEEIDFNALGRHIVSIPNYLNQIRGLLDSTINSEEIGQTKELVHQRSKKLAVRMNLLSDQSGFKLAGNYLNILRKLGSLSIDIASVGIPASKQAYDLLVKKLNDFKHELLPKLIAELETLEENIGLKPGTLSQPVLEAATELYKKVAENVIASQSKLGLVDTSVEHGNRALGRAARKVLIKNATPVEAGKKLDPAIDLQTMTDTEFLVKRRAFQQERLDDSSARLHSAEKSEQAAVVFFKKLEALNSVFSNKSISTLSIEERQELAFLYNQFQSYVAKMDPNLDKQIAKWLNLNEKEAEIVTQDKLVSAPLQLSMWDNLSQLAGLAAVAAYNISSQIIPTELSELAKIQEKQGRILHAISAEIATERQRTALIKDNNLQSNRSTGLASIVQTNYEEEEEEELRRPPRALVVVEPMEFSRNTLFAQVQDLQLSSQLREYREQTIEPFLQEHLDEGIVQSLQEPGPPYQRTYAEDEQTRIYKELFNAIYQLEIGLAEIEKLGNHEVTDNPLEQAFFLANLRLSTVASMENALNKLLLLKTNPSVEALIDKGLRLIQPITDIAVIGSSLKKLLPLDTESSLEATKESVKHLGEALVQLQVKLHELRINKPSSIAPPIAEDTIETIMAALSNAGVKPKQIKQMVQTVKETLAALNNSGEDARAILVENLQKLRSEFGASLIIQADDAEFHLGLKPGTFSTEMSERFDAFYQGLLEEIEESTSENDFRLLIDLSPTQKRIEHERERLAQLNDQRNQPGKLKKAFDVFTKLAEEFEQDDDLFDDPKKRQAFITLYKQLLPSLVVVTEKAEFFFQFIAEKLEAGGTKELFQNAMNSLVANKEKFTEMVHAEEKTTRKNIQRSEEKLEFLTDKWSLEQSERNKSRFNRFKEQAFEQCIAVTIRALLEKQLGPYADAFLDELKLNLNALKADILHGITMEDGIEKEIEKRLTAALEVILPEKDTPNSPIHEQYLHLQSSNIKYQEVIARMDAILSKTKPIVAGKENPLDIEKALFVKTYKADLARGIKEESPSKEQLDKAIDAFGNAIQDFNDLSKVYNLNERLINSAPATITTPERTFSDGLKTALTNQTVKVHDRIDTAKSLIEEHSKSRTSTEKASDFFKNIFLKIQEVFKKTDEAEKKITFSSFKSKFKEITQSKDSELENQTSHPSNGMKL